MKKMTPLLLVTLISLFTEAAPDTEELLCEGSSEPFPINVQLNGNIRFVDASTSLPITYSERWGGTNAVSQNGEVLFSYGGEGVFEWTTPADRGRVVLTNMAGEVLQRAELIVDSAVSRTTLGSRDALAVGLDLAQGVRPALRAPVVQRLTYSDRWDNVPGGTVTIAADGRTLFTGKGEGIFEWSPKLSGPVELTHSEGEATSTCGVFVMATPNVGFTYNFRLTVGNDFDAEGCTWSLAPQGGALPEGLELTPEGFLRGKPHEEGNFSFTAQIKNSDGKTFSKVYPLRVTRSGLTIIMK